MRRKFSTQRQPTQFQLICKKVRSPVIVSVAIGNSYNTCSPVSCYTSVACAVDPSVTTSSTDFSFQNLVFFNLFEIQQQKSLKIQYLPHSESKSYQINSIKSCSLRSFQQHQRHIPIPLKFSAMI
jgi:hypothetical protein